MTSQTNKGLTIQNFPVFLPISWVTILWQLFVIFFVIADFVLTVMVQCFESYYQLDTILFNYLDRILIPIMFLDILMTFNTCYVKNGVVIYDRSQIAIRYVKSVSFWVDFICLVISIIQVAFNSSGQDYTTAYNFIIFIKVIKVYHFDKNLKLYGLKSFNTLLIYQIIKNIIFLSIICFTLGAFLYLLDYQLLQQNYYPQVNPNPQPYWITTSDSLPMIINQNLWVKVTYCYYFIIVLLSGVAYGDLVPQNPWQTFYVTLLMLFPLVIYSYIFNAIYNIISKKRQKNKLIRKYLFITTRYLKNLRVKKTLQTKLITYLTFIFKKTAHNTDFINTLAPSIKKQYMTHNIRAKFDFLVFQQLISVSPRTNRSNFEDELLELIKEEVFPERYKLILPPNRFKLYYLNQGICKRVAALFPTKYSDQSLRNQYFAYYPFLTGLYNPKLTYQSSSFVTAQSIDRFAFLNLLKKKEFFELKQAFFLMMEEKRLYNNQTIDGQLCFFCHSSAHPFDQCHRLKPPVGEFSVIQKRLSKKYFMQFGTKRRLSFRKKLKQTKIILGESPLNVNREEQKVEEVQVQCNENDILRQHLVKPLYYSKVTAFLVYYPQFNIAK